MLGGVLECLWSFLLCEILFFTPNLKQILICNLIQLNLKVYDTGLHTKNDSVKTNQNVINMTI